MGLNGLNDFRTQEQKREVRARLIQEYLEKYFGKDGFYTKMRTGFCTPGEGCGGD